MIRRIVKMHFKSDKVKEFEKIFAENREKIRVQEGCLDLVMLRERSDGVVYFTYSLWREETDLENYRHSQLFKEVWAHTKSLFAARAEAWSCEEVCRL